MLDLTKQVADLSQALSDAQGALLALHDEVAAAAKKAAAGGGGGLADQDDAKRAAEEALARTALANKGVVPAELRGRMGYNQHPDADADADGRGRLLFHLFNVFGSDKGTFHGYFPHYSRFFGPIRHRVLKMLEVGISTGASIMAWLEYFPNAIVHGIDISERAIHFAELRGPPYDGRRHKKTKRFRKWIGSMTNRTFLREFVRKATKDGAEPFDIIVEDGAHSRQSNQVCWEELFRATKPGGFYAIEDLGQGYNRRGGSESIAKKDATTDVAKQWIDVLHRGDSHAAGTPFGARETYTAKSRYLDNKGPGKYSDHAINAMWVSNQLVILQRADPPAAGPFRSALFSPWRRCVGDEKKKTGPGQHYSWRGGASKTLRFTRDDGEVGAKAWRPECPEYARSPGDLEATSQEFERAKRTTGKEVVKFMLQGELDHVKASKRWERG